MKNPDCVLILANCLRSLEQQVKETFDLAKKSSESQIKGELALQDVNKAISFIGEKFDAYEKERRENEKKIEELNGTVSKMNERIEELENKIDRQEQYSRRNCILIHGIAENKEENTDQQAIDFINENLDIKIDEIDIDRSHRIGRYDKTKKKARPIIVKFARYNVRGRVFQENWKLKVVFCCFCYCLFLFLLLFYFSDFSHLEIFLKKFQPYVTFFCLYLFAVVLV